MNIKAMGSIQQQPPPSCVTSHLSPGRAAGHPQLGISSGGAFPSHQPPADLVFGHPGCNLSS